MKKKVFLILSLILLVTVSACGGSSDTAATDSNMDWGKDTSSQTDYEAGASSDSSDSGLSIVSQAQATSDKIIYRASAEVETDAFDDCVTKVYALLDQYLGFIENASITGRDYYNVYYNTFSGRSADFVLRVPTDQYESLTANLDTLGAVTYLTTTSENVSSQYADIESRLNALRVKEERILALLEQATTMEDIIYLEEKLSDVIYQIESYTTNRNYLDSQVNYSTINLTLVEVEQIHPDSTAAAFSEKLISSFTGSIKSLAEAVKALIIVLVILVPWLAVLAIIGVPIFIVIRRRNAKNESALQNKTENQDHNE